MVDKGFLFSNLVVKRKKSAGAINSGAGGEVAG
jgi:hypothetical protein